MKHRDSVTEVMLDHNGKSLQIGSTVQVGEPTQFDSHKEPFSGVLLEIMEERKVVMVRHPKDGEHVVDASNVSLLARAEEDFGQQAEAKPRERERLGGNSPHG